MTYSTRGSSWTNADKEPDEPLPLFAAGGGALERGMDASSRSASSWTPAERAEVEQVLRELAARPEGFTTDDVWKLARNTRVTKGIGAVLRAAVRAGKIRNTGRTVTSRRTDEHGHAQRLTLWEGIR